MQSLPYLVAYLMPAVTALGLHLGGAWSFSGLAFVFVLTPLLDAASGKDEQNPDAETVEARGRSLAFNLVLWAWLPVQAALLAYALWWSADTAPAWWAWIGAALSVGVTVAGGGITIAHELMHRAGRFDRAVAEALMTMATYTHFCVEHVFGHHKNVATPEDPAFAPQGQTLYAYLPQTLIGGLRSAWKLETRRATKRGEAGTWRDRRVRYALDIVAIYAFVGAAFGAMGLLFFAVQSVTAMALLELINYVEHYGLARAEVAPGRFERVTPRHSWNSSHRLTKYFLFGLPRHADHHASASRPFYALRHFEDAPQLPAGYATMVLASLVPPLWFHLMDRRVDAWRQGAEAGLRADGQGASETLGTVGRVVGPQAG